MTNFRDSVVKSMNLVRKTWNMSTYDDHLHVQLVIFIWYFMKFINNTNVVVVVVAVNVILKKNWIF